MAARMLERDKDVQRRRFRENAVSSLYVLRDRLLLPSVSCRPDLLIVMVFVMT